MKRKVFSKLLLAIFCFMCITNVEAAKVSCGNVTEIPEQIPKLTSDIMTIIQVLVPVILVIIGTIDFVKSVSSQKEEEIKKGQQMFIKRLIVALLVFCVFVIVKLLISLISDSNDTINIVDCMECFVNNDCR